MKSILSFKLNKLIKDDRKCNITVYLPPDDITKDNENFIIHVNLFSDDLHEINIDDYI